MFNLILSKLFLGLIRFYQLALSPLLRPSCRFEPSCSVYGTQAIKKYGPWKGGYLAIKRILRCHPWGGHGYDPLP
ncbi:MAG: membrane protein insertion efficiency factor YidD [Bacteroidia bacterium]|nr:membrane protein insertion efficiency factor YidD [Bacteroidota bacterium]MBP6428402.1 membrane protein insertion efficiency factor YidD [Bacteroidia bacterium]MBP6658859.1 membrane protein insertion efficiency factor YidD [Bacteroidia bacterium]